LWIFYRRVADRAAAQLEVRLMATPQVRRKWQNNDHNYLSAVVSSIGFLLQRNGVLTSQGNPMLDYTEIQAMANAQAIAQSELDEKTSL
jgi:hypothetical protein